MINISIWGTDYSFGNVRIVSSSGGSRGYGTPSARQLSSLNTSRAFTSGSSTSSSSSRSRSSGGESSRNGSNHQARTPTFANAGMTTTQRQSTRPDTSFMGILNARMTAPLTTSTTKPAGGGEHKGETKQSNVTYLTADQKRDLGLSPAGGDESSRAQIIKQQKVTSNAGRPVVTSGTTSMYLKDQPGAMQPYQRPKDSFYIETTPMTLLLDKAYQNKWWEDFEKKLIRDFDPTKQKVPSKEEMYKSDISYLSERNLGIATEVEKTNALSTGLSYIPFVGGFLGKNPIAEGVNWQYVSAYYRAKSAVEGQPDVIYRNMLGTQTYVPQQKITPTELEAVHLNWAGKNVGVRYMDIGLKTIRDYSTGRVLQTAFNEVGTGFNYMTTRYGGKVTEKITSAVYPAWEGTKLAIGGYLGYKGGKQIATDVQNKEYLGAIEKGLGLTAMVGGGVTTQKTSTFGITTRIAKFSSKYTAPESKEGIAFVKTPTGIAIGKSSEYFKSYAQRVKTGEPTTGVHTTNYPRGYQRMTILEGGKVRQADVFVMERGRKGGFFSVPDFATGNKPTSAYYFGQRNLPSTTLARSFTEQWKETKGWMSAFTYPARVFKQYYSQVGAPIGELKVQTGIDIKNPSVWTTTHPGGKTGKAELEIVQKWGAMERTSKDVEFTIRPGTNEFYRIERYKWLNPAKISLKQDGKTIFTSFPEKAQTRGLSGGKSTYKAQNTITDIKYDWYGELGSRTGYSLISAGMKTAYPAGALTRTRGYASLYQGYYKAGGYPEYIKGASLYKTTSEGTKPYQYVTPKYVPEKIPEYTPYIPPYVLPSYQTYTPYIPPYVLPSYQTYTLPYTNKMEFASGGGLPFPGRKRKALGALRGYYKPDVFSINFGIIGGQGAFTSPFLRPM